MDKPRKLSNLPGSDFSSKEDYQVALDKDVKNLFNYTTSLPTSSGLGDGTTIGDIIYWGAAGWTLLHPGTSGQVLVTAGGGLAPFWDWVYQAPGAQASSDKFIYLNLGNPVSQLSLILMNQLINKTITMNTDPNTNKTPQDTNLQTSHSQDIVTMSSTISNLAVITLTYSGTVA